MDEQDPTENFTGCQNSQLTVHMIAQDLKLLRGLSNPIKILGSHGNDIWADSNQYHPRTQSFLVIV